VSKVKVKQVRRKLKDVLKPKHDICSNLQIVTPSQSQAKAKGLGSGLRKVKPKPRKSRPKPWLEAKAKPTHH
jgi:hypothetical protein